MVSACASRTSCKCCLQHSAILSRKIRIAWQRSCLPGENFITKKEMVSFIIHMETFGDMAQFETSQSVSLNLEMQRKWRNVSEFGVLSKQLRGHLRPIVTAFWRKPPFWHWEPDTYMFLATSAIDFETLSLKCQPKNSKRVTDSRKMPGRLRQLPRYL